MNANASYYCDTCNDPIEDPAGALVVMTHADPAVTAPPLRHGGFLIVHKNIDDRRCDPESERGYSATFQLDEIVGEDGITKLLSELSPGPFIRRLAGEPLSDYDSFVDLLRRVLVPNYEEARHRFDEPEIQEEFGGNGANDVYPYTPVVLAEIRSYPKP